jgi:hypothetical protein
METKIMRQNHARKWGHIRLFFRLLAILCLLLYTGCAQVPKQSVELSATVGRDIAQVYKAHRELVVILYPPQRESCKLCCEIWSWFLCLHPVNILKLYTRYWELGTNPKSKIQNPRLIPFSFLNFYPFNFRRTI